MTHTWRQLSPAFDSISLTYGLVPESSYYGTCENDILKPRARSESVLHELCHLMLLGGMHSARRIAVPGQSRETHSTGTSLVLACVDAMKDHDARDRHEIDTCVVEHLVIKQLCRKPLPLPKLIRYASLGFLSSFYRVNVAAAVSRGKRRLSKDALHSVAAHVSRLVCKRMQLLKFRHQLVSSTSRTALSENHTTNAMRSKAPALFP